MLYKQVKMIIANPIYDGVFKLLMSNARIARFFISTIIDETIVDVEYQQQEIPYDRENNKEITANSLALFRLDFVATIKTKEGRHKKILIEIQKTRKFTDIMRFRNYLGEHYKREDEIETETGKKKGPLDIIPIYLLGFRFPHISSVVLKVERNYTDVLTREVIKEKEDFIELLTHDCYVVQIPRIDGRLQTRLERLLSFFEQRFFTDDEGMTKEYKYPIDANDEDMKLIADTLQFACSDPASRRQMEAERAAVRAINIELEKGMEEIKKALIKSEKDKEEITKEKNNILKEKDNILKENEEKDKEIARKNLEIDELKRKLGLLGL